MAPPATVPITLGNNLPNRWRDGTIKGPECPSCTPAPYGDRLAMFSFPSHADQANFRELFSPCLRPTLSIGKRLPRNILDKGVVCTPN